MGYTRNVWEIRIGTDLNRWRDTISNTIFEFVNQPTAVTQAGTPFRVDWLNNIEAGIQEAADRLADVTFYKDLTDINAAFTGTRAIIDVINGMTDNSIAILNITNGTINFNTHYPEAFGTCVIYKNNSNRNGFEFYGINGAVYTATSHINLAGTFSGWIRNSLLYASLAEISSTLTEATPIMDVFAAMRNNSIAMYPVNNATLNFLNNYPQTAGTCVIYRNANNRNGFLFFDLTGNMFFSNHDPANANDFIGWGRAAISNRANTFIGNQTFNGNVILNGSIIDFNGQTGVNRINMANNDWIGYDETNNRYRLTADSDTSTENSELEFGGMIFRNNNGVYEISFDNGATWEGVGMTQFTRVRHGVVGANAYTYSPTIQNAVNQSPYFNLFQISGEDVFVTNLDIRDYFVTGSTFNFFGLARTSIEFVDGNGVVQFIIVDGLGSLGPTVGEFDTEATAQIYIHDLSAGELPNPRADAVSGGTENYILFDDPFRQGVLFENGLTIRHRIRVHTGTQSSSLDVTFTNSAISFYYKLP